MQFSRYLTYRKNSTAFRGVAWLLKGGFIAASFYYIAVRILAEQFVWGETLNLLKSPNFILLFGLVIVLMAINWAVEAKKWQVIARSYQSISFSSALKAILAGVSLDAVLPFGAGAVSSKLLSVDNSGKKELVAPIILAQGIQSFWTVVFGAIGVFQLASYTNVFAMYEFSNVLIFLSAIAVLVSLIWWKFWPKKIAYILQSVASISISVWSSITFLSLIRYIIFFVQLMLLSLYLAPEIPVLVLAGCITWMFFAKTIVPKPGHLGALGIRGASVVFFLNLAGYNAGEVVLATLILWFINLALPSLVGLYFIKDLSLKNAVAND